MKILEMIAKWRRGCMLSPHNPIGCTACTGALIDNIENYVTVSLYSGCITPKLHAIIKNLRDAVTLAPASIENNPKREILVRANELESLLEEFFRLDMLLRRQNSSVPLTYTEEDHRAT